MYQLEVKHWLVAHRFRPDQGWDVVVDIDAMERAKGPQHKPGKAERAKAAELCLVELGARFGAHPQFGRADIVAYHPTEGLFLVEVEGDSSRQKEQAVYSALGQLVLQMHGPPHKFVLAVPDDPSWERQVAKIPGHAKAVLGLSCALVCEHGVREA